jgi:hypothetical protein
MDEKSHSHHDLIVFVRIVWQCVDDKVEETLMWTIRHDLRQLERPMGTYIQIYMNQKLDYEAWKMRCWGRGKWPNRFAGITDHECMRGGGDQVDRGHDGTRTPSDGRREVRSHIATKTAGTVGRVNHGSQGGGAAVGRGERWMGLGRESLVAMWLARGAVSDTRTRGLFAGPQIHPKFQAGNAGK